VACGEFENLSIGLLGGKPEGSQGSTTKARCQRKTRGINKKQGIDKKIRHRRRI
jgi:hypothetical protein